MNIQKGSAEGLCFLKKKKFLVFYSIILVSLPSGGCVDYVDDNGTNRQGCQYDFDFLQCHIFSYPFYEW